MISSLMKVKLKRNLKMFLMKFRIPKNSLPRIRIRAIRDLEETRKRAKAFLKKCQKDTRRNLKKFSKKEVKSSKKEGKEDENIEY